MPPLAHAWKAGAAHVAHIAHPRATLEKSYELLELRSADLSGCGKLKVARRAGEFEFRICALLYQVLHVRKISVYVREPAIRTMR